MSGQLEPLLHLEDVEVDSDDGTEICGSCAVGLGLGCFVAGDIAGVERRMGEGPAGLR